MNFAASISVAVAFMVLSKLSSCVIMFKLLVITAQKFISVVIFHSCSSLSTSQRCEGDESVISDDNSSDCQDHSGSSGESESGSGEGSDSGNSDDNGAVLLKVNYKAGDFAVVKFKAKESVMHYVAELMKMTTECDDKEWCVKFLRKQMPSSTLKFVYRQIEQIYDVRAKDFVLKLPLNSRQWR